ncbi:nucleoid occlusion protein [Lutispora thermophila]|uniref:Nucleoid occlusion protein n=1 Tax=Lutispora saccharofermentans TaxID=3024236 RepID=A0ABT1NK84_9FIRM|nr:nucleoid occlusion protein [Lutispora saccharofermentans]MCQ1531674.1 nucleoid occlusion protein [Lutispora saccharofermentans]
MIELNENKSITNISIENIAPNPYQPRKNFNNLSLDELSESIKAYGVLQPINVRKIGEDGYELIAGERRLRAAKIAGLEKIPAIIVEVVEQDSAVIALIENLQREDLNFLDEAEGYYNLINDHGMTQEELARKVGKNQSTIANKLRLLRLPSDIKKEILENNLTERHARALLKLPEEKLQNKVVKAIISRSLNVKKTEELVEKYLDEIAATKEKPADKRIRGKINYNIYINTIKNTYKEIVKTGFKMQYNQEDKGDYIEISIKVPKA